MTVKHQKLPFPFPFLQLDEENKWAVYTGATQKLAACRVHPTTMEEDTSLVVEWHKLIFSTEIGRTFLPLTTY